MVPVLCVVYQKRPVCICKRILYTSEETCKRDEIRSSERDEKRSTSLLTERDETCVSKETRSDLCTSKETRSDVDSFDPKRRNLCVKRDEKKSKSLLIKRDEICVSQETKSDLCTSKEPLIVGLF